MKKTNLQPLGKNLIVQQREAETKTASGLIVGSPDKPNEGTVIAIGEEIKTIKEGDKVMFSTYGGQELKYNKETFLMLKEHDILAIIKQ